LCGLGSKIENYSLCWNLSDDLRISFFYEYQHSAGSKSLISEFEHQTAGIFIFLTHPALRAPLPTKQGGRENPDFSAGTFNFAKKWNF